MSCVFLPGVKNGTRILSCRKMKQGKHPEQPQCSTQHTVLGRARQAEAAILLTTVMAYFLYQELFRALY